MTTGDARWILAPGWGLVDRPHEDDHGGILYLASLARGEIHVVAGPAAAVCRAATASTDTRDLRSRTADVLGVSAEDVDREVLLEVLGELQRLGAVGLRPD